VSFKAVQRGLLLCLTIVVCFLRYGLLRLALALQRRTVTPQDRAMWMQQSNRLVIQAMGIRLRVEGPVPRHGTRRATRHATRHPASYPTLIAANHLSYLDIVIASAAIPCAFVAKHEIADWPIFGSLGTLGGSIFIDRASRVSAWDTVDRMAQRLLDGVPVLLFPEGTSTDGSEVLRFHSTLFAPAIELGLPVTPLAIFYVPDNPKSSAPKGSGLKEKDLCWYGDDLFFPHLLRVLGVDGFTAVVRFGEPEHFADRRTAAWRSHDAVAELRIQSAAQIRKPEIVAASP
jgi:1-acyl-sn-glycerol-3-phosphate acyltransferase